MKLATACILLVACGAAFAQGATDRPQSILSAPGGRFVFGQISAFRADQFMLDTLSGQLWEIQCADEKPTGVTCSRQVLVPIFYSWTAGQSQSYSYMPQLFQRDEPPPKKH